MEKSSPAATASFPVNNTLPVVEALQVAFAPFTLRRPLKLYGTALGMQVGTRSVPQPNFLVELADGTDHQKQLRRLTGRHYKNFENFVRKRNRTTPTTKRLLQTGLKIDEATLDMLAHGNPDGPLLPMVDAMFAAAEGMFIRMFGTATAGRVRCSCCGRDVLDDAVFWWAGQPLRLEPGAYEFVDRLLKATVGAVFLMALLQFEQSIDFDCLRTLAAPDSHPIGHWMDMAKASRELTHDWELTVGRDPLGNPFGPAPEGRLRKWRSGQDLLPKAKALVMVHGSKDTKRLTQALLAARTLALAIDVVQAAADQSDAPGRRPAQELVAARLAQIGEHLYHGLNALSKARLALRPSPQHGSYQE